MKLIRLPTGERARVDADCISITQVAEGRYVLNGSLLSGETSIAIIGGDPYESYGLAEAAGASWAEREGVRTLYVSTLEDCQLEEMAG